MNKKAKIPLAPQTGVQPSLTFTLGLATLPDRQASFSYERAMNWVDPTPSRRIDRFGKLFWSGLLGGPQVLETRVADALYLAADNDCFPKGL